MGHVEAECFITQILAPAEALKMKLPQVFIRLPTADFLGCSGQLWNHIRRQIMSEYPQHTALLNREDLAFRVVYRPTDNNLTLPGFNDKNIQTHTLSFWYGMDYKPQVGEYVGMTRGKPWEYYMLPDPRYTQIKEYRTIMYIYDNADDHLVAPGQTTTFPIPKETHLTQFLRMKIEITWCEESGLNFNPLVHDSSIDSFAKLARRTGLIKP